MSALVSLWGESGHVVPTLSLSVFDPKRRLDGTEIARPFGQEYPLLRSSNIAPFKLRYTPLLLSHQRAQLRRLSKLACLVLSVPTSTSISTTGTAASGGATGMAIALGDVPFTTAAAAACDWETRPLIPALFAPPRNIALAVTSKVRR